MKKLMLSISFLLMGIIAIHSVYGQQCNPNTFINSGNDPATIEYDNIVSSFHSTLIRDIYGTVRVWGANASAKNGNHLFSPKIVAPNSTTGADSINYNYTGTILKFTTGSYNQGTAAQPSRGAQFAILTTEGLYAWGNSGLLINTGVYNSNNFGKVTVNGKTDGLPAGVSPTDVKMMFGTQTALAIVTNNGQGWVLSNEPFYPTSVDSYRHGDGTSDYTNKTVWHRVSTAASTPLDNIIVIRGTATAMMALTSDGDVYTWGRQTLLGNGTDPATPSPSDKSYATKMKLPSSISASNKVKMIGVMKGGHSYPSYHILTTNGELWGTGSNSDGQLGDFTGVSKVGWVRAQKSATANDFLPAIAWMSPSEHDGEFASMNVLTTAGKLWSFGSNEHQMLGTSATTGGVMSNGASAYPTEMPGGLSSSDKLLAVETGGHTTMIIKQCSTKFGYVGHSVDGSMANGVISGSAGTQENTYSFNTADIYVCGALSSPLILNNTTQQYCTNSTITLTGSESTGTFAIIAGGTGSATISGNQLTFTGAGTVKVSYTVTGFCSPTEVTFTVKACHNISGSVWLDDNGDAIKDGTEAGTDGNQTGTTNLFVNLVGPDGKVISSVKVNADGTYNLPIDLTGYNNTDDFKVIITNTQKTTGAALSTSDALGNGYGYTGTNVNGTATRSNRTGVIELTDLKAAGTSSSQVSFGISNDPIALSVVFGTINAQFVNGQLVVDFTTVKETNNSHFEIEASTDGVNFTKIGEVVSQAKDGNSSSAINYTFSKDAATATAVLGFGLLAIGGLGVGFKRNRKLIFGLMMLIGMATAYTGCTKNDTDTKDGNLFVRIVQVDKDGGKSYSKVVIVKK